VIVKEAMRPFIPNGAGEPLPCRVDDADNGGRPHGCYAVLAGVYLAGEKVQFIGSYFCSYKN